MSLSISQPVSESDPSPQGPKISIKRCNGNVQISLQCSDEYQAIEVYDRLVRGAQRGSVQLDLKLIKLAPASAR